jgi:hypothetical protein
VARKVRIPYPGTACHDLNRGDWREAIFAGDHDRRRSSETLKRRSKGDREEGSRPWNGEAGRRNLKNMTIPRTDPFPES